MAGVVTGRWLTLLIAGSVSAVPSWGVLRSELEASRDGADGSASVYVRDVRTGTEFGHRADTPVYLSSTLKIVVMLEVLRQVDEGRLALDGMVVFSPADVRDGVGPIGLGPSGRRFRISELLERISELLELMMDQSDNAAADLLMSLVGLESLNRLPARRGVRFGAIESLLQEKRDIYARLDEHGALLTPRQVYDLGRAVSPDARAELFSRMVGRAPPFTGHDLHRAFESYYREGANSAPLREVGALLAQVARCDGLRPDSCALAHRLMRGCRTGRARILAGLPPAAAWEHKTGTQDERACDVGIWYPAPERPVVIAVCVRDFPDVRAAERLMARVGRAVAEGAD